MTGILLLLGSVSFEQAVDCVSANLVSLIQGSSSMASEQEKREDLSKLMALLDLAEAEQKQLLIKATNQDYSQAMWNLFAQESSVKSSG